jgi:1-hydroxycarotenoid 3,4-desaturase
MDRVVIVGAGIGALVSAVELASHGIAVTVIEKEAAAGGKMRQIPASGRGVDAGPTVFTMRWVFDELFDSIGSSLDHHVTLKPVQILARHAWDAGGELDLHADHAQSAAAIGRFAGAADARRFSEFCERAAQTYRKLETPYLRARQASITGLIRSSGWRGLSDLVRISPFATLWDALSKQFRDVRLQQLFGRYATYCGSSPYLAPATLMLVAHVEQEGVWLIDGGMYRLVQALTNIAMQRGVSFHYGTAVAEVTIDGNRANGVRLANGEWLPASAVIVNGDVNAVASGLLGESSRPAVDGVSEADRSLSAITWTMAARCRGFPMIRHNVFFGSDYRSEFDQIFRQRQVPLRPTMYICAQDRDDAGVDPSLACERLLCLINAPADGDRHDYGQSELKAIEERSFALLKRCGLDVEAVEPPVVTTPTVFNRLFPGTGGALYGQASHGWKSCFTRPTATTRIPGLFLAGGSTHPGAGVPMAALSGRFASAAVMESLTRHRHAVRS